MKNQGGSDTLLTTLIFLTDNSTKVGILLCLQDDQNMFSDNY